MEIKIRPDEIKEAALNFLKRKPVLSALASACLLLGIFLFFFPSVFGLGRKGQSPGGTFPQAKGAPSGLPGNGVKAGNGVPGNGNGLNFRQVKMSLEIVPSNAFVNTTLHLAAKGFKLPDAQVEWTVNGADSPTASPNEFDTAGLMEGDKIQAVASVNGAVVKSGVLTIGVAPPQLTRVKLMPETFKPGDNLYVEATAAGATGIVYEWSVNGKFAGNASRLAAPVKRGDHIAVKITPCSSGNCGQPAILQYTIGNMPPMFSRSVEASFDGTTYTARVSATDPDNDTLTYSLQEAPAGMSIGPASGVITWKVSAGELKAGGKHDVTVVASDGHGGTTRMTFTIKPQ
ncbi:MAG: cadherin repeat domain-containing protein [Nitrospiraceae bacterium]|nr:cadherin repeat domain-containing protein [Nitrospiraceae bacterium]